MNAADVFPPLLQHFVRLQTFWLLFTDECAIPPPKNQNMHLHTNLWEGHQWYLYVTEWWKQGGHFCMLHNKWKMNARCKFSAYKLDFYYSVRKRGDTHCWANTNKRKKNKNPSVFNLVSFTRGVSRESGGPQAGRAWPPPPKTSWHAELKATTSRIDHISLRSYDYILLSQEIFFFGRM